ncbi:Cyclic nucleotide-regulated ion channel family protein isoform 2 [Theobroma cacao]|uniref:Cyclic nucleotide-regulated ion channel family protein isoform 2 n=1 Tax=Theobroma cacao TaxID=3641 RepID=A0A061EGQ6_THECC|nr:Cyclic nucleotide-regulated ion channel family protein isoform 2 [Theobroma cacao]
MPSLPFPRWFGLARTWGFNNDSRSSSEQDGSVSNSIECYACTQVGVPVFHSTSCDSVHQPQWEAFAGSSLFPVQAASDPTKNSTRTRSRFSSGPFGKALDPRSALVQRWNRVLLVARGIALAVDPLFFYTLTLITREDGAPCVFLDSGLAAIVTVVRTCVDAVHLWHIWLQFRLAYVSKESLVVGCGKLVWDARAIASHYVRSLKGFWFDVFVILPVPQVAGGCWYVLATQRVVTCLQQQCERSASCNPSSSCSKRVCSQYLSPANVLSSQCGGKSITMTKSFCFDPDGPFRYGIYEPAPPVISSNSLAVKILYPIFWGLLNLSSFGNQLSPTSNPMEVAFSICIVLGGLLLFTLLVGNIQVFLHVVMANRKKLQLRRRDVEWWMRRRQLPSGLRQRVRHFESQTWDSMGGEEEMKWIEELPEGLRRDIKRYLCLDLIKKVPLFHSLDDLILENVCDRVKPLIYSKDEKIIREGDPVPRMVFIVRGHARRSQGFSKGIIATSVLEPGGFLGDELLSWCLRRPFLDRLPTSSATFTCDEFTEAFGLDADDLRYITEHFRYRFAHNKLKRTARYYSSNWRTWAAVNIQFAWRFYKMRTRGPLIPVTANGGMEGRLRKYAAMFMSLRPHDHLE